MKRLHNLPQWMTASLVVPVAMLMVIYGCGGGGSGTANPPSTTRGVTLFVQDPFSQQPIENASVQIGTQNFKTNSRGEVSASVQPGTYQLQVSKGGYATLSTHIACYDGARFSVNLTPILLPATDQNFQNRSEQVFAAAENLRKSIAAIASADESTNQDVTLQFVTASNAFIAALNSISNYSPSKARNSMSGRLDFIPSLFGLMKISQGTEEILRIRNRLLAGEDVPEVDAWLAQNPYQGARSLSELRTMYPGPTIAPVLHRLLIVYERQNQNSGFSKAMDGTKDIWLAQLPDLLEGPKNLLGWTIDKVWNGAGKLIVRTVDYASLVLQNKEQIAWFWDKVKGKLILVKVKNEQQITLPQTTYDIVISNGTAHAPTSASNYQLGSGVQTLTITPTPISITPIGFTAYVGQFTKTFDVTNYIGTCRFTVNISLKAEVPPENSEGKGNLIVNGSWSARVIALAPDVTSVEPSEENYSFQNEKATLSCDLIDQPKTVEGVVEKIWNNAGAWVGLAGEIGTSAINGQVGFMARFGAFTAYVNEPVTLKKQ
ncbi:MAG: carboxypeptidase-like regulatory domain-containing protein [Armatimonadetes bacterium]|nr:carboxypeptidase-like regulatory domain-containing protein [Armatimonadota bacterium]